VTIPTDGHPLALRLRRVADNLDLIYVRTRDPVTGRWGNSSLADLDVGDAAAHIARLLLEGRTPVAVTRREESE